VAADLESLPAEHVAAYADACEQVGLVAEAVRACRLLLQRDMEDAATWGRLASLHSELGDGARAARCADRARALDGDAVALDADVGLVCDVPPQAPGEPWMRFEHADLLRFADLFRGREDVHARQWYDRSRRRGGYSPVREPLGPAVVRAHLEGRATAGAYLLRVDDTVTFCVLDLDVERARIEAASGDASRVADLAGRLDRAGASLCGVLGQLGLPFLYEDSGYKGRHLWVFLEDAVPAARARELGAALLHAHRPADPALALEFFPKQDRLEPGGLGNLVKLPLGVHQVTGRRAWLLRADGRVHVRPLHALRGVRRCPPGRLERALQTLRGRKAAPGSSPENAPGHEAREDLRRRHATVVTPQPPPWREEDFREQTEVSAVLEGCAVLRRLVERALAGDALSHDSVVCLRHVLGHLDDGPRAFNFLLQRVPGAGTHQRLGRPLRGSPSSCANLSRRLPGLARKVGCRCRFGERLPTYPNPLLHLRAAAADEDAAEMVERLGVPEDE